ncbi:MAG TPA: sensor histidine kinase [Devosiaceae bacterium]
MRRGSIAATLFALSAGWLVVALLATTFLLSGLYSQALEQTLRDTIEFNIDTLVGQLASSDSTQNGDIGLTDPRFSRPATGWYWQIRDANGQIVNYSQSLFGSILPALEGPFDANGSRVSIEKDNFGARILAVERRVLVNNAQFTVMLTGNVDEIDKRVNDFRGQALIVLGAVGAALAIMSFIVARVALRPIDRLSAAVEQVREGEAEKVEGNFPREIAPLAEEVNELLRSNAEIINRARNQVGNLAHGLKTPLAVLRNEAGASTTTASPIVLAETDKMASLVSIYLDRASLAARSAAVGRRTNSRLVLERLTRVMQKLHPDRIISFSAPGSPWFRGDESDLEELTGNLMDNACKWSHERVSVTLDAGPDASRMAIVVEDDGPGLSEEDCQKVLRRGVRLDEKTPGSGLGLDIVKELVDVYGGSIELTRSALGGLRASLILPAARPGAE